MYELFLAAFCLLAPVGFFWGGCGCCPTGAFCNTGCTTNPNGSTATIVVTGVANGDCTNCGAVNGTYILTLVNCSKVSGSFFFSGSGCSGQWSVGVAVGKSGADTVVQVSIPIITLAQNTSLLYQYTVGSAPQACPPTGVLTLGYLSGTMLPLCDHAGIGVTVEFS